MNSVHVYFTSTYQKKNLNMQKCSYFVAMQVVRYKLFFIFYFFDLCVGMRSPIPLYPLLSRINWLELERLTLSIIMQMLLKDSLKGLVLSSSGLIRDSDYKYFFLSNSESLSIGILVLYIVS